MSKAIEQDESLVTYWQEQIKYATDYKTKFANENKWADYRKMYRGDWQKDVLPLNITFSAGRTIVPRAYFRNPRVFVQPTHPDFELAARIVEKIDNWLIKECLLKQTMRSAALHSYLSGTGPIKLGFDSEFGYLEGQAISESGETITQVAKKQARHIEYNTAIKPGMPWALPELPDNVIIPYGYKYANQLPWIDHRILRPLQDVLQDTKYRINRDKPLQGTRATDLLPVSAQQNIGTAGEMQFCELHEIRDASNRTIMVLCEDQMLLSDLDALQVEGLPWEFVIFNEDPEHFWGIPDVRMIEGQQLELNEIKSQIQAHRAIALLKFIALKGALKPFDIKGLLSGDVGPYIEVEGEMLAAALTILQPHIPPDLYTASREVLSDIQETLRISANQMAAFKAGTPPTAQETSEVSGSHSEDIDDRRDIVGDVLVNIIRKWNQMIFSLWKQERVMQIVGPEGQTWVQYTGDQIKGEYNLKVDVDTGFKVDRMVRMQAADKLFAQFNGDTTLDAMQLKKMVLGEYEWIFPGVSSLLNEQLPPEILQAMSGARQPQPQGASAPSAGAPSASGNRGGGREAGKVVPYDKAKQGVK